MLGQWDASVKAMIERLRLLEPLSAPFELGPGRTVVDPVKYHAAIVGDADAGPNSARSLTGAFQEELGLYLKIREKA